MKLVDANVLIYAVDASAPKHETAKRWLDDALSGAETVLLPWTVLLAFVRIVTNPRVYTSPASVDDALAIVQVWLGGPAVSIPQGGASLLPMLREHLEATGSGGNLVTDAFLAALARANRATVVTFDSDFGRFPGVEWMTPR